VDGSAHMMNLLVTLQQGGAMSSERGKGLLDGSHFSRCYRTSDERYLSLQCLEPRFYKVFLDKLGVGGLAELKEHFDQSQWSKQSGKLLSIFCTTTPEEWLGIFANSDPCVAPVLSPEQAMHELFMQSRGVWVEKDGVLQSAAALRFSTESPWVAKTSPKRDQHRQAILDEVRETRNRTT